MEVRDPQHHFTAALGRRFDFLHLHEGKVAVEGLHVEFPAVADPRTGAPSAIFSRLAEEHPWDIGEQAFSTFLLAFDQGKPQVALPVFPSRFFPHTGLWINERSGIRQPADLVGRRVACGSFATNYAVWCRGILTQQYDVPVQRITWVENTAEHLAAFRPPRRFTVEHVGEEVGTGPLLASGAVDAATLPGPAPGTDVAGVRPLFDDPYDEISRFVQQFDFFPINTVVTVRRDALDRNPDMPRLMMDAFLKAKALYDDEVAAGSHDRFMGLSLQRLGETTGLRLSAYGFRANRSCIQTMIAFCYEQGIIRRLYDPEQLFLLPDS